MDNPPLPTIPAEVVVRSLKYDRSVHREWRAHLLEQSGPLVILEGEFEQEVRHTLLGNIAAGTVSTEYYWTDRCYSVFRFREPAGALRCYYCNVNAPAVFARDTLSFVDLDIDVLVAPDFSYKILDEDEFETNAARFGYTVGTRRRARAALDELLALVRRRDFPFDR